MKVYLIFFLLFISTSAFSSSAVINSKFHNPDNKKNILKTVTPTISDNRVINSKFHHPGNKEHHVIKKSKNK
ncbi:hypothetical protein [Photobacterium iliopiscarium]|uniref:hypothetical protein n=1 Tax=Photobacterium iliopiscarium TaxID=56192 RepID=UPI001E525BA6|nr:hypothetical protein [Photobacterium iliopiscarium]MCD9465907.1 hypothetical protein [Photobacterium iliopiscarium]MCD9486862.1 hypothetical protein [Photobacterium iliopiscarium]MCF2243051.1 hypothetical protein [Photobacterium iliopiscarium]